MNGSETILAVVACCAMLAAFLLAALAYRLNENWASHCKKFADLLDEQNHFMARMNKDWYNAYMRLVELKAEAKHDDE